MNTVLVLGRGHIGTLIADCLHQNHYTVISADQNNASTLSSYPKIKMDINNISDWENINKNTKVDAIISALPFHCNTVIIDQAKKMNCHYFDLTESEVIAKHAKKHSINLTKAFVPQCGIAPGLINIIAHDLLQKVKDPTEIQIKVGALPQKKHPESQLNYAHIWSLEGLIEEYSKPATVIENGKKTQKNSLENHETVKLLNTTFEAFNTSGGIGSLIENLPKSIQTCHYKTLRYPGHKQAMELLMHELNMQNKPQELCQLLNENLPKTKKDQVICHVSINKTTNHKTITHSWSKIFYPQKMYGKSWTAIQLTTALSVCAVVDIVMKNPSQYQGYIEHHRFTPQQISKTPFGKYLT